LEENCVVNQYAPVLINFKYVFDVPGVLNCLIKVLKLVLQTLK